MTTNTNATQMESYIKNILNDTLQQDIRQEIHSLNEEITKINEILATHSDELLVSTLILVKNKNTLRLSVLEKQLTGVVYS